MKLLVFDIYSDYGHFKKPFTTTSPLTYPIPTKTSLYGIISAIIGFDKNSYLTKFQNNNCKIGIKINSRVKKVRLSENLINTKTATKMHLIKEHTQIRIEFLKDINYRIYFYHSDIELYNKLKSKLESHSSYYTISLGLSENLANYNYLGEFNFDESNSDNYVKVSSVIDRSFLLDDTIEFEDNKEYTSTTIPAEMNPDREVTKYSNVLLERTGKSISAKVSKYYHSEKLDENIILF